MVTTTFFETNKEKACKYFLTTLLLTEKEGSETDGLFALDFSGKIEILSAHIALLCDVHSVGMKQKICISSFSHTLYGGRHE